MSINIAYEYHKSSYVLRKYKIGNMTTYLTYLIYLFKYLWRNGYVIWK